MLHLLQCTYAPSPIFSPSTSELFLLFSAWFPWFRVSICSSWKSPLFLSADDFFFRLFFGFLTKYAKGEVIYNVILLLACNSIWAMCMFCCKTIVLLPLLQWFEGVGPLGCRKCCKCKKNRFKRFLMEIMHGLTTIWCFDNTEMFFSAQWE